MGNIIIDKEFETEYYLQRLISDELLSEEETLEVRKALFEQKEMISDGCSDAAA